MQINATIDIEGVQRMLGDLKDQAPKRVGFAMNSTANLMQKGIQNTLQDKFTLRRAAFVKRTIYRKKGEDFPDIANNKLMAAVRIDETRDVLAKFEDGGTKSANGGKLAVPIIRTKQPRLVIGRENKYNLKNLPPGLFNQASLGSRLLHAARTGYQRGKSTKKARKPTQFFGIVSRSGVPLILERTSRRAVKVIYAFKPSVPLPKRLDFYGTAERVFNATWPAEIDREIQQAIERAAKK